MNQDQIAEIRMSPKEAFEQYVQDSYPHCDLTWSKWEEIFRGIPDEGVRPYAWYAFIYRSDG